MPLSTPRAGPGTLQAPFENFVVEGHRRLVLVPEARKPFAKFEDRGYEYRGWQPGNGRDPNTDAYIGEFGTAYGESSPAPGANLSAPGTISPIQSGLRR